MDDQPSRSAASRQGSLVPQRTSLISAIATRPSLSCMDRRITDLRRFSFSESLSKTESKADSNLTESTGRIGMLAKTMSGSCSMAGRIVQGQACSPFSLLSDDFEQFDSDQTGRVHSGFGPITSSCAEVDGKTLALPRRASQDIPMLGSGPRVT
jgi:hypothetical protein